MNARGLTLQICVVILCMAAWRTEVTADDAPRPSWTTSRIAGTPTPPAPYMIRPAFPHLEFENPTSLVELPDGRMMVTEIGGRILTFENHASSVDTDILHSIEGARLWHATIHPEFETNGELFVCYSKAGTTHVSRFQVEGSPPKAKPNSEVVLLVWPAGGHNGGCLAFGNDGMLYISTGDGSGPNPPDGLNAAQDVSNLFGCLLRIDVDHTDGGGRYAIPLDNPFVDLNSARPEIWSYGLRNPWKFGIDRATGSIFVADNGWESWEMIHQIVRGGNCGWPIMEGRAILRSEVQPGPTPIRPPVKDLPHSQANSVIGGPVYRGSKHTDLQGTFVYGDYITGTIWGLKEYEPGAYSNQTLVDTDQRITAFAETSAGDILVVDYDYTGQIYELVPSEVEDRSADFPQRLSETGLFSSLRSMTPAAGVVPYDIIAEQWVDGAESQRWVAIPGSGTIALGDQLAQARYPDGTVFVKHLTMPSEVAGEAVPLETQLLHFENGVWNPYSYVWDDDGGDASLVDAAGLDREVRLAKTGDERTWHVNAENECRLCHTAAAGFVLGFRLSQLDRGQQVTSLASARVITPTSKTDGRQELRLVDPFARSHNIDDRARSYLHANCSSCHHPGGSAIVSFYLRRDLPFSQLRTSKPAGVGSFGLSNAQIIAPGAPDRSVLLYRMLKLGYARMPYVGSRSVDSRGVVLIDEWIRSMPRSDHASGTGIRENASIEELLKSSGGAMALAVGIHGGKLDEKYALRGYASPNSDIRGLFETFIPERDRRKTLGPTFDPETVFRSRRKLGSRSADLLQRRITLQGLPPCDRYVPIDGPHTQRNSQEVPAP